MVNKLKHQATVVEGARPLVLVRRRFQRLVSSPSRAEDGADGLSVGGVAGPTWTRTRSVSPVDILVLMSAEVSSTQSNPAHSVSRSSANYQTLVPNVHTNRS